LFERGYDGWGWEEGVGEEVEEVEVWVAGDVEGLPFGCQLWFVALGVLLLDVGGISAEYMWFMSFQFIQQQQRYPPTAALLNSSFQKAKSRIQLTRTTDVGFMASFRAEMAKREVSQFALQPSVLVRSVRDCEGGRARYGSRAEGVRLRCEEAIVCSFYVCW
jgi:hypothetical protein